MRSRNRFQPSSSNTWKWLIPTLILLMGGVGFRDVLAIDPIGMEILAGQQDQLAGQKCNLRVRIKGEISKPWIGWRLMAGERTLKTGRSQATQDTDPREEAVYVVIFETPEVRRGVSLQTRLYFEPVDQDKSYWVPITIRHPDPFGDGSLDDLRVLVFDPTEKMIERLKETSLSATFANRLEKIQGESYIVVSEGTEWDEHLKESFYCWMHEGRKVLVLGSESRSPISLGDGRIDLKKIEFGNLVDSRWIPKKVDADYFQASTIPQATWDVSLSSKGWALTPRIETNARQQPTPAQWQVAEFQSRTQGIGLFVGVPLMENWDRSPVPRECLKHMLAYLSELRFNDTSKEAK